MVSIEDICVVSTARAYLETVLRASTSKGWASSKPICKVGISQTQIVNWLPTESGTELRVGYRGAVASEISTIDQQVELSTAASRSDTRTGVWNVANLYS